MRSETVEYKIGLGVSTIRLATPTQVPACEIPVAKNFVEVTIDGSPIAPAWLTVTGTTMEILSSDFSLEGLQAKMRVTSMLFDEAQTMSEQPIVYDLTFLMPTLEELLENNTAPEFEKSLADAKPFDCLQNSDWSYKLPVASDPESHAFELTFSIDDPSFAGAFKITDANEIVYGSGI